MKCRILLWILSLGTLTHSFTACRLATPSGTGAKVGKPSYEFKEAKCTVNKSQLKPLIVEWTSTERASLEARVAKGPVFVRYAGCSMEVLSRCSAPSKYIYRGVTPKKDRVRIKDADELYANIPLGAAKFEADLKQAGELNINMTIVGRHELDKDNFALHELIGPDCSRATHVVLGLTNGAFDFYAGAQGSAGAGASILGAGVGGKSASSNASLNQDGDEKKCQQSATEDSKPPEGCGAILSLEMVPIEGAAKVQPVTTPSASVSSTPVEPTNPPTTPEKTPGSEKNSGQSASVNVDIKSNVKTTPAMRRALPWIGFGVGLAGFITGTVTGVMVLGRSSSIKDSCPNKECTGDAASRLDGTRTLATVSNIGMIAGGVGVAVGTLGIILNLTSRQDTSPADAPKKQALRRPVVLPWAGRDGAGVVTQWNF